MRERNFFVRPLQLLSFSSSLYLPSSSPKFPPPPLSLVPPRFGSVLPSLAPFTAEPTSSFMAHARDSHSSPSVDGSTVAGRAAIDSLLMESNVERPFESEESFAQWVQTSYRRWSLDPTISEQLRILDLETVHEDVLSRASQRLVRAQEEYASCPAGSIIDGLRDKVSKLRMECQGRERQKLAASNGDASLTKSAREKSQKSSERLQAAYAELDGLTRDLESKISSCAEVMTGLRCCSSC